MPPTSALARRHHLEAPALPLGEPAVHPEQFGGEQRRLVAARAGADLEQDVLLVVRVLRDEQDLRCSAAARHAAPPGRELLLRELAHLGVAALTSSWACASSCDDGLVLAEPFDQRLDFRERLGVLAVLASRPAPRARQSAASSV